MPASSPPPPPSNNNVAHSSPLVHRVSVARLPETTTSSSSSTTQNATKISVQITTQSNAKNYVAKCRNHRNPAKKKTNEKNSKREKTFMREEKEEKEEEEYESLFRVKREFPDDFLSFRNELREAYPGCVVPKLFRRPSRRDDEKEDEQQQEEEGDAELFLRRCCESPTIAASRMLESFLTEGVFTASAAAAASTATTTSSGLDAELKEVCNVLAEDADVRAVKEEQERRGRFSASAWFASLFNGGGGSGSNRGSAKERKYTRTRHTVLKDEDPTYLQVITYASKLDEQCEAFVRSAELYIDQLEKRVNATKLRDLGEAALKMGQSEEGWGKALQKRSKNYSLGYTLHALSDCAESMTFTGTASELRACEALRTLVPSFEDCRQRVEAIRETFEDRTTALLHYQIACDVYDEVIETHGRAVANIHPECLEADAKREIRRKTYDLIVERTREEYSRWHASIGVDMTRSLRAFAKTRAVLCRQDAECWEMMLRDPIGDGDVKMDDRVGVDDRDEREIEAAAREGGREQPRGKLLSTKEKLLLEKNARRIQRMEKRRKKEEREVLRAWKREAKEAIANGQNVPEMPTLNEEKTKKKNGNSNGDAENGNEENTKNDFGGKDKAFSSSASSSASSSMPSSATTTATKTTSSSLFNSVEESSRRELNVSVEVSEGANYAPNVTKGEEQQQQQQKEKSSQIILLSRPPPEPFAAVKTEEASISEGLAAMKMAAVAEDENDSEEWSD